MNTLMLPDVLAEAGVNVRVLDGWTQAHDGGTYIWRNAQQDPDGHIHHHTATSAYTPNRDKASGYAGISIDGSERLYQAGDGEPTYTIANAFPAPISAGQGVYDVLENYVRKDVPFVGKQTGPDDSPLWYGNTHYWNTEYVLDGIGSALHPGVRDMMVTVSAVMGDLMGWSSARNIGHGQHTKRKPDLWDGKYADMGATIDALRNAIDAWEGDEMVTHFTVGMEDALYEEVSWLLYQLSGGTINVNAPSSQVEDELGKTNVRLVTDDDFTLIADLLSMSASKRTALFDGGLYRFGKEIAKLRKLTYT